MDRRVGLSLLLVVCALAWLLTACDGDFGTPIYPKVTLTAGTPAPRHTATPDPVQGNTDLGTPIYPKVTLRPSTSRPTTPNHPASAATPGPTELPAHIIAIDPGHGGPDDGTFHGAWDAPDLREKDVTLKIGLRTAALLRAAGYGVVLTRTTDTAVNVPPVDLTGDGNIGTFDELQARIDIANKANADLFLSIHINGSDAGNDAAGGETWYSEDRPFSDKSKTFAQLIQAQTITYVKAATGYDLPDRGASSDANLDPANHIFLLGPVDDNRPRATNMPGALTEPMFITNDTEVDLLRQDKTIDALAHAYADAVMAYYSETGG